ncbi:MAG: hypothetical protein M4579_000764 [Chaenotheca gracillima]|nr:MAG: hypothetical protein M4579_000764 [Chaenotheca gracillima]
MADEMGPSVAMDAEHPPNRSPRSSSEATVPTDSMVTVRLSDTDDLASRSSTSEASQEVISRVADTDRSESRPPSPEPIEDSTGSQSSGAAEDALAEISLENVGAQDFVGEAMSGTFESIHKPVDVPHELHGEAERASRTESIIVEQASGVGEESSSSSKSNPTSARSSSAHSSEGGEVDWDELERNEEQEPRDEGSDESTAFLLARLEQENNALATDPKSNLSKSKEKRFSRQRHQQRPPSIHHLKKLVDEPTPPSLRYSLLPAPPPMTDLEFYAALVADYPRTAQCLPTLLSKKIRSGIPPPLRGVVWMSMAGARDSVLEEQYESLCGESSPYENMIGKDIGRSFPGVEMFREPDGEGQKLLGQVLKCFSLYDQKIGYCQGLGFVVGPLLMHMGGKEAFCVLVRFMEQYDLRSCFLPDLSGLHLRIYQFKHLLAQHLPAISNHLETLQIEPAYLSQWFLSFFGVTCPVPMLLRIYDVIFAEGAAETMMRVALSVMRRNESKILASTEFEDVMQLLLSRGLWDTYGCDADEFVNDFVGLTGVVTHEGLQALETAFKTGKLNDSVSKVESSSVLQAATASFLGRLWTSSPAPPKSANLAPGLSVPSRPSSFLRRSPSKQSVASTLNSAEGGSESSASTLATDLSTMSRDSSADGSSLKSTTLSLSAAAAAPTTPKTPSKDRDLHGQIEDLLTALGEMQRDQTVLVAQLQREREEREEDRRVVRVLVDQVKRRDRLSVVDEDNGSVDSLEKGETGLAGADDGGSTNDYSESLSVVETRLGVMRNSRFSTIPETKHQLRNELNQVKEQHGLEVSRYQELERRLNQQDQEMTILRDELKDARSRVRESHQEKQRLEQTIQDMQSRKSSLTSLESYSEISTSTTSPVAAEARSSVYGGLREFKLNRTGSLRSQTAPAFSKRTSSLNATALLMPDENEPSGEQESLLAELVQSKTAEAVAKQEAEELRAKLESLRKLIAAPTGASGGTSSHRASPSQPPLIERKTSFNPLQSFGSSSTASGTAGAPPVTSESGKASPSLTPPATVSTGGFWSGWGKRSFSSQAVPTTDTQ